MEPRLYIETSVISYLAGRPSRDLIVAAHQQITTEWWSQRASDFILVTSVLTFDEARAGDASASERRLSFLEQIQTVLPINEEAITPAQRLVAENALPIKALADALHVAVAAINACEFLLTWNCTHIANAETMPRIESTLRAAKLTPPRISTPLTLMQGKQ